MQENIIKADFSKVMFSLRYDNQNDIRSDTKLFFKDMTFRALSGFPLIKKANGVYSNYDHRLVASFQNGIVTAKSGENVDLSGSRFVIPDTKILPSPAQLSIMVKGRLRTVLELLNNAPFYILDRADQNVDIADGEAKIEVDVTFPIKSGLAAHDVSTSATGEIVRFATSGLFNKYSIFGKKVRLELTPASLILRGITEYKDIDLDTEFKFDFETGVYSFLAGLDIDQKLIDSFTIPIPSGVISGSAPADLKIVFPKKERASFSLESDLLGAALRLDQFD
jgi:hypothetical protein